MPPGRLSREGAPEARTKNPGAAIATPGNVDSFCQDEFRRDETLRHRRASAAATPRRPGLLPHHVAGPATAAHRLHLTLAIRPRVHFAVLAVFAELGEHFLGSGRPFLQVLELLLLQGVVALGKRTGLRLRPVLWREHAEGPVGIGDERLLGNLQIPLVLASFRCG